MFRDSNSQRLGDGISILRADRQPCPVCGHPTGDCTGEEQAPKKIVGLGGVMESLKDRRTVLIEEDIFEEKRITPFTTAKVITHHKGSYVTVEEAKKLGLL